MSTDDQQLGPEAQRAAIEAWARSAGVTFIAWCSDLGVSGAADLAERPGLQLALDTNALERDVLRHDGTDDETYLNSHGTRWRGATLI